MLTKVKKVTKTVTFPCLFCEGTGKVYRHCAVPDWGGLREWEEVEECPHCEGNGEYTVRVTAPETFWKLFQTTYSRCGGTGKVVEAMYDEQNRKHNPVLVAEIDELEF